MLLASLAFAVAPSYEVGPRDLIHVDVYGEDDLSADYEVAADGTVTVPFVGLVPVAGRSSEQIATLLTKRFLDGILVNPQVTVRVVEHRSQRVEVYGAVKKPGAYYLDHPTNLLQIIGKAGWTDDEASDTRHVTLRRADGTRQAMALTDLVAGALPNLPVKPGDIISVEEGQFVYVGGEVKNAGPVVFSDGLTVSQALLRAGGASDTGWLRGAYIVRSGEKIPVNLKHITDGKSADVKMKAGDQLFIKLSPI